MEYYKEYPIRCKTCNEQLSCFAADYESFLEGGLSEEDALNAVGIVNPCSRIAMTNPTIVTFNMENREVIEGFKSVAAAEEADVQSEHIGQPIFNSCMGTVAPIQTIRPTANVPGLTPVNVGRVPVVAQGTQLQLGTQPYLPPGLPGIQTIGLLQPAIQRVQAPTQPTVQEPPILTSPTLVQPIIAGIDLNTIAPIGVGIPVNAPDNKRFSEPTMVGVPTINTDPTVVQPTIFVGANKQVRILNGRTYLAQ